MQGKIVHFELNAKDAARAKRFYSGLFGWKYKDSEIPGVDNYFLIDGIERNQDGDQDDPPAAG